MKFVKLFLVNFLLYACFASAAVASEKESLFSSFESKKQFAEDVSTMILKAWKPWQDGVLITDVKVEGSQGIFEVGDMRGDTLTKKALLKKFDRKDKSQDYIMCVRAVASALENGMRKWQKGYENRQIQFPQGANCVITLSPCQNIPVTLDSGESSGDGALEENALYNFMLYRSPNNDESTLLVLKTAAKGISEAVKKWKASCSIVGLVAQGGIGPSPAPMGSGPGPVRGAKANNGKLIGTYIDKELLYSTMMKGFSE